MSYSGREGCSRSRTHLRASLKWYRSFRAFQRQDESLGEKEEEGKMVVPLKSRRPLAAALFPTSRCCLRFDSFSHASCTWSCSPSADQLELAQWP